MSKYSRTSRQRRRKAKIESIRVDSALVTEYFSCARSLSSWLCCNGFKRRRCHVTARYFSDTGRGLMALKSFKPGDILISLPKSVLITASVIQQCYLGPIINGWTSSKLSTIDLLTVFVMCERRRGRLSPWQVYIDSLPTHHTLPLFWTDSALSMLPFDVRQEASKLAAKLTDDFHRLTGLFDAISSAFPEVCVYPFTIIEYHWAATCVNTRCIHLAGNKQSVESSDDDIALAPFLDMFNHSPDVQVEAGYDRIQQSYIIRTHTGCRKYKEVFINYGPHSNKRLLLDYGFMVKNNPHDCFMFTSDDVRAAVKLSDFATNNKFKLMKKKNLDLGLLCTMDGLSWNLRTALLLLTSSECDLHQDKRLMDIYLQRNISPDHEQRANSLAKEMLNKAFEGVPTWTDEDSETDESCNEPVTLKENASVSSARETVLKCGPISWVQVAPSSSVTLSMARQMCIIYSDILNHNLNIL